MHSQGRRTLPWTQEEQGRGDTMTQETPSTATPQETGPPKQPIIHIGGSCKKAKAHKKIPEYTITEDDADLVAERVHDCKSRNLKRSSTKEYRIQNELADIRQVLEQIQVVQRHERGTKPIPSMTEAEERTASSEEDTIQTIA
jgi:hypothetical protein